MSFDTRKYKTFLFQLLNLLTSKRINHYSVIANGCVTALYESSPDICEKYIIDVVTKPLSTRNLDEGKETEITVPEWEVNACMENLMTCFAPTEAKFKSLPCRFMSIIAVPLFCIHNKIRSSSCSLRNEARRLLYVLLREEHLQRDLFSAFLGYDRNGRFGRHVSVRFGSNGGVEIVGTTRSTAYEEYADSLFDLASVDDALATNLFSHLLTTLSTSSARRSLRDDTLETPLDTIERVEKRLAAIKLLSLLAKRSDVQEAQLQNPEPLLNFIESLFNEKVVENEDDTEKDDHEVLYVGLMLIKMILSSEGKSSNGTNFESFGKFLKERTDNCTIPSQLVVLMKEIVESIEDKRQSNRMRCDDLSVDDKKFHKFEEAIRDLSDPLLPVRAHGIITLTKLIERKDPFAVARRAILLRLFQVSEAFIISPLVLFRNS